MRIPEVKVETGDGQDERQELLYPADPGSNCNMTKMQDQLLFAFYNKNDRLRITHLHQGIVWGRRVGFLVNLFI